MIMKKEKAMYIATMAILTLVGSVLTACSSDDDIAPSTVDTKEWTIGEYMDTSYKPGDNFFMYCNGAYWNNTTVTSWQCKGFFYSEADEIQEARIAALDDSRLVKFENELATMEADTVSAWTALQSCMSELDGISTRDEAIEALAKIIADGYETPLTFIPGAADGKVKTLIQFTSLSKYSASVETLVRSAGCTTDEAQSIASDFKSAIAKLNGAKAAEPITFENLEYSNYKRLAVSLKSLSSQGTGYTTIDKIVELIGFAADDVQVNSEQSAMLAGLDELTAAELKSVAMVSLAGDIKYISQNGVDEYNKTFARNLSVDDIYEAIKEIYLGYIRSYSFASKYTNEDIKNRGIAACKELQTALRARVQALDWMSETTKQKAIAKVDNMVINVAYPDHWIEEGLPTLDGNSFYEDLLTLRKAKMNLFKYCMGKDRKEESLNVMIGLVRGYDLTIVNAAYSPIYNSISIYPVFLLEPFYTEDASDACNYARYAVIGHEMTHALDNYGSQYDEIGNNKNWWTVADKMTFNERLQTLTDCYNNLEILPDESPNTYANGEKTLGENVADLGGFLTAYDAYMNKLKTEGYYGDELTKQEKKFFQTFADFWRAKYDLDYASYMLECEAHSLPKERINGVVMNIDRWYELYDVQWGDKLYLSPERRSYIW